MLVLGWAVFHIKFSMQASSTMIYRLHGPDYNASLAAATVRADVVQVATKKRRNWHVKGDRPLKVDLSG